MGKKRRKTGSRARKRGAGAGAARPAGARRSLAEAVRRGSRGRGQALRAVRLAQEAVRSAASAEERLQAEQVLAEAHLQAGLAAGAPTDALAHVNEALRANPSSPRLAFYRGLALLQLGKTEQGRTALEQSLRGAERELPGGTRYARQLARLADGTAPTEAGLAEDERLELSLVASLLASSSANGAGTVAPQLGLFPSAAGAEAPPLEDTRVWRALVALKASGSTTVLGELEGASAAAPPPARARIRYYEAVCLLRLDRREEAGALLRSLAAEGLDTPWLRHNLSALLREATQELAREGRWEDVVRMWERDVSKELGDRILAETVALAHDHLAHDAATVGGWAEAARHWRRSEALHPRRQVAQNLALAEEALGDWAAAAAAWRAMARRRPRKPDHPDYLADDQVAALWRHAAECYERAENESGEDHLDDVLTCLETALKYAPEDAELRLEHARLLYVKDANAAAARELDALLEDNPRHLEALKLRAAAEEDDLGDPAPFLRRALELVPQDADLRDALARTYMKRAVEAGFIGRALTRARRRDRIRLLEEGLAEIPDHPGLLAVLGGAYREAGKISKARETLLRALETSPRELGPVGDVLHELVHIAGADEDVVLDELPRVRRREGLLPRFWTEQARRILECDLPTVWFDRFVDEAVALVGEEHVEDSVASVLAHAWVEAMDADEEAVARRIEQRMTKEVPESGAVQLVQSTRLIVQGEFGRAKRLLAEADRRARRAHDEALRDLVQAHRLLTSPAGSLLRMLEDFVG